MALYCANPNMNSAALGLFNASRAMRAELQPNGPTANLRGGRPDLAVATSGAAFGGYRMQRSGLSGLGDWFSDAVGSVGGAVTGIVDGVTGRGAARDQAQAAAQVAAIQAQARIAEANASSQLWGQALPALGIAVAAAVGLGLIVVLKR